MINHVSLVGRLTKDIELKKTASNLSVASFTVACDRHTKEKQTDFVNCVVWRQGAEYLSKYAHKGDIVGVEGSIQTRSYDGQNGKVFITEVNADNVCIIGGKKEKVDERRETEVYNDGMFGGRSSAALNSSPSLDISPDDLPFY